MLLIYHRKNNHATKVDMSIIVVRHRRFGVYEVRHTAFASHRFKHIPESDTAFGSNVLLIANQILDSRHGTKFTIFCLIITVADA